MDVHSRLFDALITQGIVRTLVLMHWISMRYVFVNILCNDYAMLTSCIVGFLGIVNFWLLQDKFKDWSKQFDDKRYKICWRHQENHYFSVV